MKTLGSLAGIAMLAMASLAMADEANLSPTGYQSESGGAGYVSMDAATTPAVATTTADTQTETQVADAGKPRSKEEIEACAKAQQKANETGEDRLQFVADQKCHTIDYMSLNPAAGPGTLQSAEVDSSTTPSSMLGADRRDQANYYPPENYKINGKEASWALTESFKQQMKAAGYDDNAIAAIGGNLQHESGMFYSNQWKWDPETGTHVLLTKNGALSRGDYQNGAYTSFGIAQYHDTSTGVGRATSMLNYVGGKNLSPNGLQGTRNAQVEYLIQDLPKQLNSKDYATLMNPDVSTEVKTGIIVQKYEIPKQVAGETYGRMGGTDRLNSALTIQAAMNAPVVPDTDSSNDTPRGGRPISNANGNGGVATSSIGSGGSVFGYDTNSGLGMTLSQLGLGGTNAGVSGISTPALLGALIANALSRTGDKDEGEAKSSPATSSTTPKKGYDVLKAVADLCGDDLSSSADAEMLKVKLCQAKTES